MKRELGSDKVWQLALEFLRVLLHVAGQFALTALLRFAGCARLTKRGSVIRSAYY